ncbi:MAG: hypothetical protein Kow0010_11900 [Dehalococcoidia bacterium]
MMTRALALGLLAFLAALLGEGVHPPAARAEGVVITVTNPGNQGTGDGATCPHPADCTLRAAIETVNADLSNDPFSIDFHPDIFPFDDPVTIAVSGTPLPAITHANVVVDGVAAGVRLDGGGAVQVGLTLSGTNGSVLGLAVHNFPGTCILVEGNGATIGGIAGEGFGNRLGGCASGIVINGAGATIQGNEIGFAADTGTAAPVTTGIVIVGAGAATIGDPLDANRRNVIGNAATGIQLGSAGPPTDVVIARNLIGKTPAGAAAPVTTSLWILPPTTGTAVLNNTFAHAIRGIVLAPDAGSATTTGNTFRSNIFEDLASLAIDLGDDGIRNPNDAGDTDTGPNLLRNHPLITRAVQSEITGTAGASCPGCTVELYIAAHLPGSPNDFGTVPVSGAITTANALGEFVFELPAVDPGDWVVALVTDQDGNTSEFGPSTRVGTGFVQCGAATLQPGWNHVAYFGLDALPLGPGFPPAGPGTVTAVYQYRESDSDFLRWLRGLGAGQSLSMLDPGQEYWFLADAQVDLPGGLPPLTEPLQVTLSSGWNDFVYIGAGADIRDALASIAGRYTAVYRLVNDGGDTRWVPYLPGALPHWAQGLTDIEPCAVYQVFMTEPATLVPLQP